MSHSFTTGEGEGSVIIQKIIAILDLINERIARFFAWFILPIVLSLVYEVIMRYVFGSPTAWSFDVTYMLCSLFIIMGLGYNLQVKGHVSVDIVYNRFTPRVRALLYIIFSLILFFPCWVLIIKAMVPYLINSWTWKERATIGTWMPPIYPFKTWIFAGLILFILQGVSEFLKNLLVLLRGEMRTGHDH